ncbi:hypothetical protein JET14_04540 [Martelella lutilitoris]|uniref:Uncharacterized protein n=1 Tax=Martelella lutilitoris TaxID=2583532 RepID=A0A7T7KN01_9HYPH|nr:hypothetical protein [Martelella lutilitoris]QQM31444.1 hypothetical protein JET14_04540 [Martelella lutilitoris]
MSYRIFLLPAFLVTLMSFAPAETQAPQGAQTSLGEWARGKLAFTCAFKSEDDDGFDKICIYDCAGWTKEIKVDTYDDCPSSIRD